MPPNKYLDQSMISTHLSFKATILGPVFEKIDKPQAVSLRWHNEVIQIRFTTGIINCLMHVWKQPDHPALTIHLLTTLCKLRVRLLAHYKNSPGPTNNPVIPMLRPTGDGLFSVLAKMVLPYQSAAIRMHTKEVNHVKEGQMPVNIGEH